MNELQLFLVQVEVARESEWAADQWPGILVPEDVSDGVWRYLTEDRLSVLLKEEPWARSMAIRWIAARVAQEEIAIFEFYSGTAVYSVPEVWRLLNQGVLTKGRADLSGDLLDAFMDIHRAVGRLPHRHWLVIGPAFVLGVENVAGKADAVQALAEELNRKRTA